MQVIMFVVMLVLMDMVVLLHVKVGLVMLMGVLLQVFVGVVVRVLVVVHVQHVLVPVVPPMAVLKNESHDRMFPFLKTCISCNPSVSFCFSLNFSQVSSLSFCLFVRRALHVSALLGFAAFASSTICASSPSLQICCLVDSGCSGPAAAAKAGIRYQRSCITLACGCLATAPRPHLVPR